MPTTLPTDPGVVLAVNDLFTALLGLEDALDRATTAGLFDHLTTPGAPASVDPAALDAAALARQAAWSALDALGQPGEPSRPELDVEGILARWCP